MRTLALAAALVLVSATAAASSVNSVQVAPDGKSIVVGIADNTLRVLSTSDGKELRKSTLKEIPMTVAISSNGKTLAVGGFGFLTIYEAGTGKEVATASDPLGHVSINSLAFMPDGKSVVAAADAGGLAVFDLTAKKVRDLKGITKIVNAVAVSSDGKTIAAAGVDQDVHLWDAATGAHGLTMKGHKTWISGLTFTSDGKSLVSADQNGHLFMWDRATGKQIGNMDGDNGWAYKVAASPDGKLLAWGADGGVQLWDVATKKPLDKVPVTKAVVQAIAFSPDSKTMYVGDYSGHVTSVDIATKKTKSVL